LSTHSNFDSSCQKVTYTLRKTHTCFYTHIARNSRSSLHLFVRAKYVSDKRRETQHKFYLCPIYVFSKVYGFLDKGARSARIVMLCVYFLTCFFGVIVKCMQIIIRSGQGQGYITTNSQSVNMSWYRAQSRTIDQSLLSP
jgi:hypothetical protein